METISNNLVEKIKIKLETGEIFNHPDLDVVCLGGSNSTNSAGRLSDIDITTVMRPENPKKVDVLAIIELGLQLRKFAFEESLSGIAVPVIIATIRLEEAQIALAEELNPNKSIVPIHWLHYPSLEFASINEPPGLVEGLLGGNFLRGNGHDVLNRFQLTQQQKLDCLGGLDWLTDSFRVLITNINEGEFPINRQPDSFLKKLSLHNLEYFWKWNIIQKTIKEKTGVSPDNWKDMEKVAASLPSGLWFLARSVRELRHKGAWAETQEIINLHIKTFDVLSNLNGGE